jgi:hypothetical protein
LNELIKYIDDQICACVQVKSFGLCHLLLGDNEQFPATIGKQGVKAVPDDKFNVTIYHRLLSGNYDNREDLSFGRKIVAQNAQKIRTVIFIKIDSCDTLIDDIINALPDDFESDGFQFANVNKNISLIRDRDAIWTEEYSQAYKDRYQMKFHVYALEYDLQYIKCNVCI